MEKLVSLLYALATGTDEARKKEVESTLSKLGTSPSSLEPEALLNSLLQVLVVQVHAEAESTPG